MIRVKLDEGAEVFKKATEGSTGLDVFSNVDIVVNPNERVAVGTGVRLDMSHMPPSVDLQIRPRSGLSLKGLIMLNAPGTIDRDYTGEIKVLMVNISDAPITVSKGDRIAQAVFSTHMPTVTFFPTDELTSTTRGDGGFGSTGV